MPSSSKRFTWGDEAQGYLYSRPVPVDQVSRLLEQGIERPA